MVITILVAMSVAMKPFLVMNVVSMYDVITVLMGWSAWCGLYMCSM